MTKYFNKKTEIDECASQPCKNNGTCSDGVNMFTCHDQCPQNFTGMMCESELEVNSNALFDLNECTNVNVFTYYTLYT